MMSGGITPSGIISKGENAPRNNYLCAHLHSQMFLHITPVEERLVNLPLRKQLSHKLRKQLINKFYPPETIKAQQ